MKVEYEPPPDAEPGRVFTLPPPVRPSQHEIERRQRLVRRVEKLREEIGPIGVSVSELIRLDRDNPDEEDRRSSG